MHKKKIYIFLLLSLFRTPLAAIPPPVPSAGIVERELEKEYEAKPFEQNKEIPQIQIDIPRETLDLPTGKKIFVRQVKIQGNESILTSEISSWIKEYLNQKLSLQDIYGLCHAIDQLYAKKGYFLARAYPPPQDIEDDSLTIEVLEGKLGNITIVGNHYYSEGFIRGYFADLQGKALKYVSF